MLELTLIFTCLKHKVVYDKKIKILRKIEFFFLICIAYMQGELNISSTYRFMLSVLYIEELDNSSLCGTRV